MAGWFKRLLESDEERQHRQMEEFAKTEAFKEMLKEQAAELLRESKEEADKKKDEEERIHRERIEKAEDTISSLTNEMRESDKPYVIVRSIGFDPSNGVEVQLDWNPSFIRYLKNGGITGQNEDQIVRKWLAMLSHEIVQDSIASDYVINGVDADETPLGDFEEVLNEIHNEQDDEDDEDELNNRW